MRASIVGAPVTDEIRQRRSWLDGFMAYPLPQGLSEAQWRSRIVALDQQLYGLWNLGEQLVFGWACGPQGLHLLVGPHPLLTEFAHGGEVDGDAEVARRTALLNSLLSGQDALAANRFEQVAAELGLTPLALDLPFDPAAGLGLGLIGALISRYGIRLVDDRAVILLDAVGFSLLTPLQQVVQLNSLSCSVNAAYALLLNREININFARTTTGDGFYIWNRMRGIEANVELYQLLQFILADNALARERARRPASETTVALSRTTPATAARTARPWPASAASRARTASGATTARAMNPATLARLAPRASVVVVVAVVAALALRAPVASTAARRSRCW